MNEGADEEQLAIVATGGIGHVREVQGVLAAAGLRSDFVKPPEGKGGS